MRFFYHPIAPDGSFQAEVRDCSTVGVVQSLRITRKGVSVLRSPPGIVSSESSLPVVSDAGGQSTTADEDDEDEDVLVVAEPGFEVGVGIDYGEASDGEDGIQGEEVLDEISERIASGRVSRADEERAEAGDGTWDPCRDTGALILHSGGRWKSTRRLDALRRKREKSSAIALAGRQEKEDDPVPDRCPGCEARFLTDERMVSHIEKCITATEKLSTMQRFASRAIRFLEQPDNRIKSLADMMSDIKLYNPDFSMAL